VTGGAGQFCTKPGIIFTLADEATQAFVDRAAATIASTAPQTMLHTGIRRRYMHGIERLSKQPGVKVATRSGSTPGPVQGAAVVFQTTAQTFLGDPVLGEEIFGPTTLVVRCPTLDDMETLARQLTGQLTVTVHATQQDLIGARELIDILEQKAGRVLINGFPTGVEVCSAMVHGGPYPATTDSRTTSVGGPAMRRFARPVCYQGFPDELLPEPLQDANRRKLLRWVNDSCTREAIGRV
jgi:NADP-dependent aldehyde dehydrogenase